MQLDINGFQNKPVSLEEGPLRCQVDVKNDDINRVEKTSNYQRWIEIIKVILYLELILFVGWIGCIFLSNYYQVHSYNTDQMEWTSDLHGDDSSVISDGIPFNDDILRWNKIDDPIDSTERSQTSTTNVSPIEAETSGSDEDIWNWFRKMGIPVIDHDIESFEEKSSGDESNSDSTNETYPTLQDAGLLQLVIDHVPNTNDDSISVPFPKPLWQKQYEILASVIPSVDENSGDDKVKISGDLSELSLESVLAEMISSYDTAIKDMPISLSNSDQVFRKSDTIDDVIDSGERSMPRDFGLDQSIHDQLRDIDNFHIRDVDDGTLKATKIPTVEGGNSSDETRVDSPKTTENFEFPPAVFPEFIVRHTMKNGNLNMDDILLPIRSWDQVSREDDAMGDVVDSGLNSQTEDIDRKGMYDDFIDEDVDQPMSKGEDSDMDHFLEAPSELKVKRSAESSSSSSEETAGGNKPKGLMVFTPAPSADKQKSKECSAIVRYHNDDEEFAKLRSDDFYKNAFATWDAVDPKPDCGTSIRVFGINQCGELESHICQTPEITNPTSGTANVTEAT